MFDIAAVRHLTGSSSPAVARLAARNVDPSTASDKTLCMFSSFFGFDETGVESFARFALRNVAPPDAEADWLGANIARMPAVRPPDCLVGIDRLSAPLQ